MFTVCTLRNTTKCCKSFIEKVQLYIDIFMCQMWDNHIIKALSRFALWTFGVCGVHVLNSHLIDKELGQKADCATKLMLKIIITVDSYTETDALSHFKTAKTHYATLPDHLIYSVCSCSCYYPWTWSEQWYYFDYYIYQTQAVDWSSLASAYLCFHL